ncbi:MAG: carbohydrate-binding domain-containing protein [Bacteroidales bacterium]|nr:carbohydrate-binding domain-containing protein [Bacteroidales bacterium]
MRSILLLAILTAFFRCAFSQEKMYIHRSDHVSHGAGVEDTDSIWFSPDGSVGSFKIKDSIAQYWLCFIDSISFGPDEKTVSVLFDGTAAYVKNPFAFEGVTVEISGADVYVKSVTDTQDIHYRLSGTTSNGMFKIYSEKRFNLELNNVNITNTDGPAINIQSKKKATITLAGGTTNIIADGAIYTDAWGDGGLEDQKAAFFSEGKMVFDGTGSLDITGSGSDKHALCSDDEIEFINGTITITSLQKDGIHAKEGITVTGGNLSITSANDGIDAGEAFIEISGGNIDVATTADDVNGITCDSTLVISGGSVEVTVSGTQSKAIKSDQNMTLSGGLITINTLGAAALEASGSGYDPSYCTAIKCNNIIAIDGAEIIITSSGAGGKGISSDTDIIVADGDISVSATGNGSTYTNSTGVKDSYHASCITADGNITIINGSVTLKATGSAGKGISCDGTLVIGSAADMPVINVTTSGSRITLSSSSGGGWPGGPGQQTGDYDESKAITCDGAVVINNGSITIASADDGIKSGTSVTISNATVNITNAYEAIESPSITVNSGNVSLVATNDGFNATYGNGGETNDGSILNLYGGKITANVSNGDGLDSNGNIVMTSGTVIVHGPSSQPEVGMDFNGTFNISGGFLIVSGSNSNMTEAPNSSSQQYSVKAITGSSLSSSTLFHLQAQDGTSLVTFKPVRNYSSVIFSSPALANGSTYKLYTGGTCTGTETNGLYSGGTYSGGTLKKSFTISGKVISISF